jgi:hypothetical protein
MPIPSGSIRIKSSKLPDRAVGRTMPTVPSLLLDVMSHVSRWRVRFAPIAAVDQPYSITSSARASKVDGTVKPKAFAVTRLITNSTFVDC